MQLPQPKFMENKEWYYYDKTHPLYLQYEDACYRLTEKAPKDAVESYLEYCTTIYNYHLGYVPEFVYEDYNKFIAKFK